MSNEHSLLRALPLAERERLGRQLEHVVLPKGRVLIEIGDEVEHAYFPINGLLSLLAVTEVDQSLELAMIGRGGFIGLPIVLHDAFAPYQVLVQVDATALRIRASLLSAELERHGSLEHLLLRYGHNQQREIAQAVVCHRFHSTSQRLSRWLVAAQAKLQSDDIKLTHESLARILGVPRTAVTAGALVLQDAGYIRYRHGRITIINRERLARTACDCYRVLHRKDDHVHVAH